MASKKDLLKAAGTAAGAKKNNMVYDPNKKTEGKTVVIEKIEAPKEEPKKIVLKKKNVTEAIMTAGKKSKETVPYTVRIEKDLLKQWKIYTECGAYGDKSKLTEAALTEYMNRHKLTAEQQAKYNALMDL